MDEISKLKIDAYDIITELEIIRKKVAELESKKAAIDLKIKSTVNVGRIPVETSEELKAKEARIMAKRLEKVKEVRAEN